MNVSSNRLKIETFKGTQLQDFWLLFLGSGIVLMILGSLSLAFSLIAAMATMVAFGFLISVGAIFQITNAFWARHWRGFVLHLLLGLMYLIVGIFLLDHPVQAASGLTMLIAASLIIA